VAGKSGLPPKPRAVQFGDICFKNGTAVPVRVLAQRLAGNRVKFDAKAHVRAGALSTDFQAPSTGEQPNNRNSAHDKASRLSCSLPGLGWYSIGWVCITVLAAQAGEIRNRAEQSLSTEQVIA
jgi:hypothetical protein